MDDIRLSLARIDENVRLLREDVGPLIEIVKDHSEYIAVDRNNKKWSRDIFTTLIGLIGVILGAIVEFFRK